MALPFTEQQRSAIRQKLFESAQRHALSDGVQRTSLDTLTSEAGISKSSFYKFYESKEQLFIEVARHWESEIIGPAMRALTENRQGSDKERAADFVFTAFETIRQLGIERFLREDLPALRDAFPEEAARRHCMNSAANLFARLQQAHIRFTAPDATVRSVIQLMYLSILNSAEIGDSFFPALRELVASACDRLVA